MRDPFKIPDIPQFSKLELGQFRRLRREVEMAAAQFGPAIEEAISFRALARELSLVDRFLEMATASAEKVLAGPRLFEQSRAAMEQVLPAVRNRGILALRKRAV